MPVKDYYNILELKPGATEAAVKRSFRKLALRFHPDTNQGNKYAEAWFRELQEAYEVLTNPAQKEAYLQQRWLQQSTGKPFATTRPLTPETVLQEAEKLLVTILRMDHFRMDHQALRDSILEVATDEKLEMLANFNNLHINQKIAHLLMQATEHLDGHYHAAIFSRVQRLCGGNAQLLKHFNQLKSSRNKAKWWQKNQWWIMLLATVALCMIIYLFSHRT